MNIHTRTYVVRATYIHQLIDDHTWLTDEFRILWSWFSFPLSPHAALCIVALIQKKFYCRCPDSDATEATTHMGPGAAATRAHRGSDSNVPSFDERGPSPTAAPALGRCALAPPLPEAVAGRTLMPWASTSEALVPLPPPPSAVALRRCHRHAPASDALTAGCRRRRDHSPATLQPLLAFDPTPSPTVAAGYHRICRLLPTSAHNLQRGEN
jgi:hypothetical protein